MSGEARALPGLLAVPQAVRSGRRADDKITYPRPVYQSQQPVRVYACVVEGKSWATGKYNYSWRPNVPGKR